MDVSLTERSPLGVYLEHCKKGELAYQVCKDDGRAIFFPRAVAPDTGSANLEWRVSKGLGTVYSTTAVHYKGEAPLNVALIDLDEPWKVIARGAPYLLSPQTYYECVGDVPNVAFPCATLYDEPTGRIALYSGGADTVTALAFAKLDEVLDFVKMNSEL